MPLDVGARNGRGDAPLRDRRSRPGLEVVHPMAVVVLGGLATSILLSLFVLPTLYLRFGGRQPAAAPRSICCNAGPGPRPRRQRLGSVRRPSRRAWLGSGLVLVVATLPFAGCTEVETGSATGYRPQARAGRGDGGLQRVTFTAEGQAGRPPNGDGSPQRQAHSRPLRRSAVRPPREDLRVHEPEVARSSSAQRYRCAASREIGWSSRAGRRWAPRS